MEEWKEGKSTFCITFWQHCITNDKRGCFGEAAK